MSGDMALFLFAAVARAVQMTHRHHPHTTSGLPSSGGSGAEPTAFLTPRGTENDNPLPSQKGTLDQLETSSQPRVNTVDDEACDTPLHFQNPDSIPFEHRGWQPMRRRVFASMCRCGIPEARKHAFWHCSERLHVMQNGSSGEIDIWPETCHDRFCLTCGQRRSRRIAAATEGLMKQATNKLMFITLTVRGRPDDSLSSMLDRLRDAWKELRRLKAFQSTIRGGVCMLEVKWSKTSGGHWHPHYHIIAEGAWLDKTWLQQAWKLITRDSDQVDVQRVREPGQALNYVAKYASKPIDASFVMRPQLIDEAMRTLKGVRLAACFGTWHGTPLSKGVDDADEDETEVLTNWAYLGTVGDLEAKASRGDRDSANILRAVERLRSLRHSLHQRRRGPPEMHGPPESDSDRSDPTAGGFGAPLMIGVA